MTAINAVLKPDRAVILTDGLAYNQHGLILGECQKTVAMPTLKAAIAVRGAQKIAAILAMELTFRCPNFDSLLDQAEEFFAGFTDRMLALLQFGTDEDLSALGDAQIVVVGWSDRRKEAVGFYYLTDQPEPFGWIEDYAFSPVPSDEEDANLKSVGAEIEVSYSPKAFNPIRHGIPLMEAQRRMKIDPPGLNLDEPISIVGGHVLVTECTTEGVSQRVIHRWNDEPGEMVIPEPFGASSQSGLSRQQRRALERQANKIPA